MPLLAIKKTYLLLLGILLLIAFAWYFSDTPVDYNADIKPLLNKKCITCHGGVKKQGGFSLLFQEEALAPAKSGKKAIVPYHPEESEMIRRLTLSDPEERMPYQHEALTPTEVSLLKRWIKQGAPWGKHWAYVPVKAPQIPVINHWYLPGNGNRWAQNPIDHYIWQSLQPQNLSPSPTANKATLLRRASLDLTGMLPPETLAKKFLSNKQPLEYASLIDSLLASPHYGEKWASVWMDLARYADTKGYERDDRRSIWRYRDWLIQSFNNNKPYNEFITEQLAGDLLPNPSTDQLIATAFHRNTLTNDEGGTDNEEFRTAAVIDRVNTTWETLMGTTFACVQCHSHPYDPFKHEEYYQFLAFFNNTRDEDTYADYPLLREFHGKDSLHFKEVNAFLQQNAPKRAHEIGFFLATGQPALNSIAADQLVNSALTDTKWLVMRNNSEARIPNSPFENHTQLVFNYKTWKAGGKLQLRSDASNGPLLASIPLTNTSGKWKILQINLPALAGNHDCYLQYNNTTTRDPLETGIQFDWFLFTDPFPGKGLPGYDSAYTYYQQLMQPSTVTYTPIMVENPQGFRRKTYVFERGNWLVKGKQVTADIPAYLGKLPTGETRNRLALARWITSENNPLTARALVNRIWEQFFGKGLVETLEDLGTQGAQPTHPELLDYLAWQLVHTYRWNMKKLMREILLSATYQQNSAATKETLAKDPTNKWYARGPRIRLSAEQVRDQALCVSSQLNTKMFGAGVFPYQPEGVWMSPYNGATWKMNEDGDQYRRAVYTYWKRSSPYPSLINFDGPTHEVCTARRIRTNTPLQSLTTLNDSAYVDLCRAFAFATVALPGNSFAEKMQLAYQKVLYAPIPSSTLAALQHLYQQSVQYYQSHPESISQITGNQATHQQPADAAWIVVMNALMNLDEVLTKN
jgi:hypothetical protein